jgi:shikimate O-hydroxycinnamoyltransferase
MYMFTNARSRICPPLLDDYLGNIIIQALTMAKVGDIVSGSLTAAAARVSDAIAWLSDEFVRPLVDYSEQATSGAVAEWPVIPKTNLWIVSWLGLPFFKLDFRGGRPATIAGQKTNHMLCGIGGVGVRYRRQ